MEEVSEQLFLLAFASVPALLEFLSRLPLMTDCDQGVEAQ